MLSSILCMKHCRQNEKITEWDRPRVKTLWNVICMRSRQDNLFNTDKCHFIIRKLVLSVGTSKGIISNEHYSWIFEPISMLQTKDIMFIVI